MSIKGQITTAEPLEYDDFIRLLSGLHEDGNYLWELYCCISFCTACRISDVLSMKWHDLLGKDELTKIENKTKKIRQITFDASVRQRIEDLYQLLGKPAKNSPVVCNKRTNEPFSKEYINRTLKVFRVRYQLPIKKFSSHTFRKTFGRFVWESMGKTTEAITLLCLIFKHSSPEITMRYLGIRDEEIQNIYQKIHLDY